MILLRYFARHLFPSILLVWLTLTLLVGLYSLLESMDNTSFTRHLFVTTMEMPMYAMKVFLFACAIGTALATQRMDASGEGAILRLAGLSPWRFFAFYAAIMMLLLPLYFLVSEVLLPAGAEAIRQDKTGAPMHALWLRDKTNDTYVRVDTVEDGGDMQSIVIYRADGNTIRNFTYAQSARYLPKQHQWMLSSLTVLAFGKDGVREHTEPARVWPLALSPDQLASLTWDTNEMSIVMLAISAMRLAAVGQDVRRFLSALWKRLSELLGIFLLAGLSVAGQSLAKKPLQVRLNNAFGAVLVAGLYFLIYEVIIKTAVAIQNTLLFVLPGVCLTILLFLLLWDVSRRAR